MGKKGNWSQDQFKKSKIKGDPKQWKNAARALLGGVIEIHDDLKILGLLNFPKTKKELTVARNKHLKMSHPDIGGSDEAARKIIDAYERVLSQMEGK
jgi:hypothetical protein